MTCTCMRARRECQCRGRTSPTTHRGSTLTASPCAARLSYFICLLTSVTRWFLYVSSFLLTHELPAQRASDGARATDAMLSAPLFAAPLFENARIRISDLRLPAKVTTTFEHTFPSVRWQVDPGVHSLGDGPPTPVADKAVTFMEAGTTWACRNDGEAESRQIVFEIKQPPSHTEEEAAALLARAEFSTDVGTALLFENRLCRVWDFCNSPPFNPGPTTNL